MKHIKDIFEGLLDNDFEVDGDDLFSQDLLNKCISHSGSFRIDKNVLTLDFNYPHSRPTVRDLKPLANMGIDTVTVDGRDDATITFRCPIKDMTVDVKNCSVQIQQVEKSLIRGRSVFSWENIDVKKSTIEAKSLHIGKNMRTDHTSKFIVKNYAEIEGYNRAHEILGVPAPNRQEPLIEILRKILNERPDGYTTMFSDCDIMKACNLRPNQWPDLQKMIFFNGVGGAYGMVAINTNKHVTFESTGALLEQPIKLKNGWVANIFPNISNKE